MHHVCFRNPANDLPQYCPIHQRVAWVVEELVQGHTVEERVLGAKQGHALTAGIRSFFPEIRMKIFLVSVGMKDRCVSNLDLGNRVWAQLILLFVSVYPPSG